MAKKTGSDELFRLIHSLSTEEKGYFKKFSRRHTPKGNIYLDLFDAISRQKKFDEKTLKKNFAGHIFRNLKLYLKEMIADSMVLYYRNNHPHIQLFNQLQKIHFLIIKGLYHEALKEIDKALKQSTRMELFNITRYLLRMQLDLSATTLSRIENVERITENYRLLAENAMLNEENLMANEFLNTHWFVVSKKHNKSIPLSNLEIEKEKLNQQPTKSFRAEKEKLSTQRSIFDIEGNAQARYETTQKALRLSMQFRKLHDSSLNVVSALTNHIISCYKVKKFEEFEELCDQLVADKTNIKLYNEIAFNNINLIRIIRYYHTGQFAKGLTELMKTSIEPMLSLPKSKSSLVAIGFQKAKLALLFGNKKFKECWITMQEMHGELKKDPSAIADLMMLEMMVQTEMGNFQLLHGMTKRAEKKLSRLKSEVPDYEVLLNFFKYVSPASLQKEASSALRKLKNIGHKEKALRPDVFGLIKYNHWLESKCTNKTLEELVKEEDEMNAV